MRRLQRRNPDHPLSNLRSLAWQQTLIAAGATVSALGFILFLVPFQLPAGGLSGLAIILNHFTGWAEGTQYFVINIPLMVLGFHFLGRWRFLVSTLLAVTMFSAAADFFKAVLPDVLEAYPITQDPLLSALYAGLVFGLGTGLVFRAGGSLGGTSVIARILQKKISFPLSQCYLYSDGAIIFIAGLVFGWEKALLSLLALFFSGFASDFVLEGTSHVRTAMIITDNPEPLRNRLMHSLGRGVTQWEVTGGYTQATRSMLFCTMGRFQVAELKRTVAETDPQAFVVVGVAQQALGAGFRMLRRD
jgi:uncharacterized membrane-anchored protein YitT (DUF2179 family)